MVIVFVLTGATLVIPWNRIGYGWVAVVPAIDIVAITLMQLAAPGSALGLLWIFPTMWLAAGFGLLGLFAVIVAIAGIVSVLAALNEQQVTYATVLLPLVLIAVATTSHIAARRSDAQRTLLAKQARAAAACAGAHAQAGAGGDRGAGRGGLRRHPHRPRRPGRGHQRSARPAAAGDPIRRGCGEDVPAFRDDGVTRLPQDELPVERALRGEAFDGQVVWFGSEPGPRQALSITARRLADPSGEDAGAVVISRDVTTELNALRARDELVASVSHELRTPLTSILGYLDLAIEDPDLPEHLRSNLDIAERNAERLLGIVADILAASSSSRRRSRHPSRRCRSMRARSCAPPAEALAPRAAARAITIDTSGLEEAPVWADPLRLRQVVDNLLSNAITYNRDGGTVYLGTDRRRHLQLDPRARHRAWASATPIARASSSASTRRARRAARAPDSASRSAATSSAPTAASSVCTARPASGPPSSSSSPRRQPRSPPEGIAP